MSFNNEKNYDNDTVVRYDLCKTQIVCQTKYNNMRCQTIIMIM